jgi:hypothetical protein
MVRAMVAADARSLLTDQLDDPDKRKSILRAEIHTNAMVYIEYTPETWVFQKAHQPAQHGSRLTMHSIGLY